MCRIGKSTETERRLVVAGDLGGGRMGLMGTGFPSGVMEMFWNECRWLHNLVNILTTTEWYILKG